MSVTFERDTWPHISIKKRFGLCDEPSPSKAPAYLDENNGGDWIAIVHNDDLDQVYFAGVDNQIPLLRPDEKMDSRCDGVLSHKDTIVFVELKERGARGNDWVKDGEVQLRSTIAHFERTDLAENYTIKKAYIANNAHPRFKGSQMRRMDQFEVETGYVLRIENRIRL